MHHINNDSIGKKDKLQHILLTLKYLSTTNQHINSIKFKVYIHKQDWIYYRLNWWLVLWSINLRQAASRYISFEEFSNYESCSSFHQRRYHMRWISQRIIVLSENTKCSNSASLINMPKNLLTASCCVCSFLWMMQQTETYIIYLFL